MKVWKVLFCTDNYDHLKPVKGIDIDEIQTYDGRKKMADWQPIEVVKLEPEKNMELSNAPRLFTSLPAFDSVAKSVLENCCEEAVEFLPLISSYGDFWAVNVVRVLDCIDYEKAEYKKFKHSGKIMLFTKYAFKTEIIMKENIFKIIEQPLSSFFVSDEFKRLVEKNNLTGFLFELAWDSEENN